MYDYVRATSEVAVLFFVSLVIFGNWILLNLFLATLLSNFQEDDQIIDEEPVEENASIFNRLKRSVSNLLKRETSDIHEDSQKNKFKVANRGDEKN